MHWHDYLAFGFFAAAAAYIGFRVYRAIFLSQTPGCGSACGSCRHSDTEKSTSKSLLSIDDPVTRARPSSGV